MQKLKETEYLNLNIDELDNLINELGAKINKLDIIQLALKLVINSVYGAFGNSYFYFHNKDVAASITAQGQDLIKFSISVINHYFKNLWHVDYELHKILGIDSSKITPIDINSVIYVDTDSVEKNSKLKTNVGDVTIEQYFLNNIRNSKIEISQSGNEILSLNIDSRVLNWSKTKGLYFAEVDKIIRHKVSKKKYKLITKSKKEVIITEDHSMIVFRDGKQLEIKPRDVLYTDKILSIL